MRRWLAIAALAVAGCSGVSAGGDAPADTSPRAFVLSPDPYLEAKTIEWAARWSAAAGVEISVAPGGTPIRAVDETVDAIGTCGSETDTTRGGRVIRSRIEIDITPPPGCSGWGYALGHEIGHALGAEEHAETGVMADTLPIGRVHVIDAASLESVCAYLACQAFNPEEDR